MSAEQAPAAPRLALSLVCRARARLSVLRLPADAQIPAFALAALAARAPPALASVTRTRAELSLILPTRLVPDSFADAGEAAGAGAPRREDGWTCLSLVPPGGEGSAIPFDMVGVLLAIARPLAAAGVGIFATSTFNTDLVMVKAAQLERAAAALRGDGHAVELLDEDGE
jgi:hypothetical protein